MPAMTPTAGGAQRRRRPGSPAASGAGAKPVASASATRPDAGSPRREEGRTSSPVSSTDRALAEIDALAFATDHIQNATGSSYNLVADDEGKTIKVRVSFTDDAGHGETLTSTATATVDAAPNSPAAGAPTITGTAQVGETLTAGTSGIADADGLTNVSYRYQWLRNDGSLDTDIQNAANSTYTLVDADEGRIVRVRVSFTDDAGNDETLTGAATAAVDAAPNSPATGAPAITGTAQVGETLTADTSGIGDSDGLTNASYSYQWVAGGSDIAGATGSSHTLTSSEQGQAIQVRVSFTDDRSNAESLTSAATDAVAAAPLPMTVSLENNPAAHNGTDVFTFEIRFSEEFDLSFTTLKLHAFQVSWGTGEEGAKDGQFQRHPLANNGAAGLQRGRHRRPSHHDGLQFDQGAICTGDGRKLSNSLNFTVSGPGGVVS